MNDAVIVGIGQIGGLMGTGALRAGVRVTPVLRNARHGYDGVEPGTPIFVAVREHDLVEAIEAMPKRFYEDIILVQNELFPSTWQGLGIPAPTLVVFWSNKKEGTPLQIGRRSAVGGKHADFVLAVHDALGIPCETLDDPVALAEELVAKFAFILTINALGLIEDRTMGEWLEEESQVRKHAMEAVELGKMHLGEEVTRADVVDAVCDAMAHLPDTPCRGRTASERVERAIHDAHEYGLTLPNLEALDVASG